MTTGVYRARQRSTPSSAGKPKITAAAISA
jgi:hypothetical protein